MGDLRDPEGAAIIELPRLPGGGSLPSQPGVGLPVPRGS